ncbi:MAG: divergent PAP2 family protein [Ruminococcaceae bacterium]|nr:divergent PAP2 family protein [Oscillospiraceae bacterium]
MNTFDSFFKNYVLICSILGWTMAQVIKFIITAIRERRFDVERLFGAGGMPSGHSATVSALVVSVSRKCGIESVFFAFSLVLAAIVIYDAMGVRRAAGEQAKVINKIVRISHEDEDERNDIDAKELKEKLGHTPLEVLGGIMLGIIIPLVIPIM